MAAIFITRREIQLNAILDILPPDQLAKLDEIVRLINDLAEDPAIKKVALDVERQIPKSRLPRMPKRPRNVVRVVKPKPIPVKRDPYLSRTVRAHAARARDVLECFEGDEWITGAELAKLVGKSERHVRETMKMLIEKGLFREEARADETTHVMKVHYQVVAKRLKELAAKLPVEDNAGAADRRAEEGSSQVLSTADLLTGAPAADDVDLGLDLYGGDTADIDADMANIPF